MKNVNHNPEAHSPPQDESHHDTDIFQENIPDQNSQGESEYYNEEDYIDDFDFSDPAYTEAATIIQRQVRVMIARNNFRVNLYKLILLKNILDTKVHKEKMQMLFAFEQLIINTEDPNDTETTDPDPN